MHLTSFIYMYLRCIHFRIYNICYRYVMFTLRSIGQSIVDEQNINPLFQQSQVAAVQVIYICQLHTTSANTPKPRHYIVRKQQYMACLYRVLLYHIKHTRCACLCVRIIAASNRNSPWCRWCPRLNETTTNQRNKITSSIQPFVILLCVQRVRSSCLLCECDESIDDDVSALAVQHTTTIQLLRIVCTHTIHIM